MKRGFLSFIVLSILILSISVCYADEDYINPTDDILSVKEAVLEITLSSKLNINPTKSNYVLANVDAMVFLHPEDSYHQQVLDLFTLPEDYTSENGSIKFNWDEPEDDVLPFYISATVKTDGRHVPVKRHITFPIERYDINSEILPYLDSQTNIDSDHPEIISLAKELAENNGDDLYKVVFEIADWVHQHITYDLSTLTADVAQKASWTLENRYGVCDEMTSLFIALLRANGIPARYISGISYTNSELFDDHWGPHGWAEVYFPGYGWIPFDVTYEEYGYIDASHIELRKSADSGEASSFYGWYGYNVELAADQFDIQPFIVSLSDDSYISDPDVEIVAVPYDTSVGFDSFNIVEVTIKNLRNYYLPYAVYLSKVEDIYIEEPNPKLILLEPGETRKLFWKVKVDSSLDENFIYTFPFKVYTKKSESASFFFKSKVQDEVYSASEIERLIESKEIDQMSESSQDIKFACDMEESFSYYDEEQTIICQVSNLADESYDLKFCMHEKLQPDVCQQITVTPVSIENYRIYPTVNSPGKRIVQLSLIGEEISKLDEVENLVLDYPSVDIKNPKYPGQVSYGDEYQFRFTISGKSSPKDLKVNVRVNSLSKTWRLDELTIDREFVISLDSKDLYPGANNMDVKVVFDDENDQSYNLQKQYSIELVDIPFVYKIVLNVKRWFEEIFS